MSTTTKEARSDADRSGVGSALRTRIELWIAMVFMVVAVGAGIAIGVLAQGRAPVVGIAPAGTTQVPGDSSMLAPPLTDEQLQQGLPSGHPTVGPTGSTGSGGNGGGGGGNGGGGNGGSQGGSSGGNP
jgi:hypothetical protein